MTATYQWMRDTMEVRLKDGLYGAERDYYNKLAELKDSKDRIDTDDMFTVYAKALRHARREMKNWGWD
jgi:hypothetical protein